MSPPPRLSVVIPFSNEEVIARETCQELFARLDQRELAYEVLACEHGSSDRTAEVLARLAAERPRLRVLRLPRRDTGRALREGILAARGEYVVCDEVYYGDVRFFERALAVLEAGEADLVVGSRRAPGASDRRPAWRRAATLAKARLLAVSFGFEGTDVQGMKAFRREEIGPVASRCVSRGDAFAAELVLRSAREGKRVVEIAVDLSERRPPQVNSIWRTPEALLELAKLAWALRAERPAARRREERRP